MGIMPNSGRANQRPVRIKCIVLGSAGAGKTSFLRRYFTGKFEPQCRRSTIGADVYSTLIGNPWFVEDKDISAAIHRKVKETSEKVIKDMHSKAKRKKDEKKMTAKKKKTKEKEKKKKKKKSKKKKHKDEIMKQSSVPSNNINTNTDVINNNNVETATLTTESSLNTDSSCNNPQSLQTAISSNGQSNMNININDPQNHNREDKKYFITHSPQISIQMWDTPGKERLMNSESRGMTSQLGDSFFEHANAAVLIYDATSSRSFLQLMKWYSDLLDRIKKVHDVHNDVYYDENLKNSHVGDHYHDKELFRGGTYHNNLLQEERGSKSIIMPKHKFPVLIVATKLDRVKSELSKQARKTIVPQRNVLGLKNKSFKGEDYHYEYTVSSNYHDQESSNNNAASHNVFDGDAPLSYGLEVGTWTADHEYEDCLKLVEDGCFPDRYMVLLWCKRNGLKHVEISSLDGTGVNDAVSTVVDLVLESLREEEEIDGIGGCKDDVRQNRGPIVDFQERYANKNTNCCLWNCQK